MYLHSIPWAFICLIPAYVIGEAWLGICLTVAIELVPIEISPASISLFLFISNNISSGMPLLLPQLKRIYGLRRAMLILFPGLYVISATLFSVSLCLLIAGGMCRKDSEVVKSKSPRHAQQAARKQRKKRRNRGRQSEGRPLLQDVTGRNLSVQDSESSSGSDDSDCGDFLEIDEREAQETQDAVAPHDQGSVATGASNVVSPQRRRGYTGRGVRGYGAIQSVSGAEPAPVVGSVSEWSMASPSVGEKRWLAESQEGT